MVTAQIYMPKCVDGRWDLKSECAHRSKLNVQSSKPMVQRYKELIQQPPAARMIGKFSVSQSSARTTMRVKW